MDKHRLALELINDPLGLLIQPDQLHRPAHSFQQFLRPRVQLGQIVGVQGVLILCRTGAATHANILHRLQEQRGARNPPQPPAQPADHLRDAAFRDKARDLDGALRAVIRDHAGTPIEVFTGPDHTVYHSAAALPSSSSPRADGKPTLAWFTNTNCGRCEDMKFAHTVAAEFRGRLVFIEKATDRDTAAATLGVTAVPAFVLLDARGTELARFGYLADAAALKRAIESALADVK